MRSLTDFDLKLLRVFVVLVEERGFPGAQERLNIAPSTLSERIKDLELRVGFAVCIRGRRVFKLTPQGAQLYEVARRMVATMDGFRHEVGQIGETVGTSIEFGIVDNLESSVRLAIANVLHRFKLRRAAFSVRLTIFPPPHLIEALHEGRIDAAVGPFPRIRSDLVHRVLFKEAQNLYCGREHELFRIPDDQLSPNRIEAESFIEIGYPSQYDRGRIHPHRIGASVQHMEAMLTLLLSGHYIGYLPDHMAKAWVDGGYLRRLVPTKYAYDAQFAAVWRKQHTENRTLRQFFDWFLEDYRPNS